MALIVSNPLNQQSSFDFSHKQSLDLLELSGIETAYVKINGEEKAVNAYALGDRTLIESLPDKKFKISLTFLSDWLRSPELYCLSMGYPYEGHADVIEKGSFLSAYPKKGDTAQLWHVGTQHPFKIMDSSLVNYQNPHPERMIAYYQRSNLPDNPVIRVETITGNNQYRLVENQLGKVVCQFSSNLIGRVIRFINATVMFRYIAFTKQKLKSLLGATVYILGTEKWRSSVIYEFKGHLKPSTYSTPQKFIEAKEKGRSLDLTPIWMRTTQDLVFVVDFVQKQYL